MTFRPSARPQSLVRTLVRPQNASRFRQQRSLHSVPDLGKNNQKGTYFEENGVPGFLTPTTYKQSWKTYQQHLCDMVNETTEGTGKLENLSAQRLHVAMCHNPEQAALYNAAAMLHFNHFWWESLAKEKLSMQALLQRDIEQSFGSVDELRNEMLIHANSIFGNGFVWLMKEGSQSGTVSRGFESAQKSAPLRILCTYNAGSPYPDAAKRKQGQDLATSDTTSMAERLSANGSRLTEVQNTAGSFGLYSQFARPGRLSNLLTAQPILCANVWQHSYLFDYGTAGKETYLSAWWERIDWDVVASRHSMDKPT